MNQPAPFISTPDKNSLGRKLLRHPLTFVLLVWGMLFVLLGLSFALGE
jgi:cytochrome c oxidase subunit IV